MRQINAVDDLQPLIDYYAGTMGALPGRLMTALSLLADLEYSEGWDKAAPDVRLSTRLAGALVGDVLKALIAAQPEVNLKAEVEAMLARWSAQQDERGKGPT